jgi:hypothetical protein
MVMFGKIQGFKAVGVKEPREKANSPSSGVLAFFGFKMVNCP